MSSKEQVFALPVKVYLDDLVPPCHFHRFLHRSLDLAKAKYIDEPALFDHPLTNMEATREVLAPDGLTSHDRSAKAS